MSPTPPEDRLTVGALKQRLGQMPDDWFIQVNIACMNDADATLTDAGRIVGIEVHTFECFVDEDDVHAEGGSLILVVGDEELDRIVLKS